MLRHEGHIVLSASDLVTFLGCYHATALDRLALDEDLEAAGDNPTAQLLRQRGLEHEREHLGSLEAGGCKVVRIPSDGGLAQRARLTLDAMRSGADVVYQAVFLDGSWLGIADFLIRSEIPSDLGPWAYDVEDTKLASRVSPSHVIQLSVYARLLMGVQGVSPSRMSIVLGTGERADFKPAEFAAYVGLASDRLEAFVADGVVRNTTAEPCAHCEACQWHDRCSVEWVEIDHLSLVANIRRSQIDRLRAGGISTVAALAGAGQDFQVPRMVPATFKKLQAQARLQVAVRADQGRIYELLAPQPGRGFERLPRPDPGDIFFDMEGDPLYPDGGLEYLFGIQIGGDPDDYLFRPFWAHDRNEERLAFEEFMDFVAAHLERHPRAHIYHYNHYEVTAVRRLASRHGTRESVVDDMLRRHRFVDLFSVVREGLRISEPRYSLKNVERFYQNKRDGEVATAVDSIVAYETWRIEHDDLILRDIETYNAIDCASTRGLQQWLLAIRPLGTPWFDPASVVPSEEALERQERAEAERAGLEAALTGGIVDEDELAFRRLVLELTEFHRREQKPQWWALFDRQVASPEDLIDDADSLGGLRLERVQQVKQSLVHIYTFPAQETKLRAGDRPVIAETLEPAGSIERLDIEARQVVLKRGAGKGELPPELSLGPAGPIDDKVLRGATVRFARSVAHGDRRFEAIEGFLRREKPRLVGAPPVMVEDGVNLVTGTRDAVARLDHSHLFVQGPPGTGKTFTASRVIVEMMYRGFKVGVSSTSHKAINNLLAAVEEAALAARLNFVGVKKSVLAAPETVFGGRMIVNVFDNLDVPLEADLIAGTAWLFARPEFEQRVDYLFVDEAGQVGLGNLVAMGTAAKSIVLVGDQMQLGEPIQGVHPGDCGSSALDYLLQGAATVAPDRGVFLGVTHRMHPDLCGWVSEAIYDGRLNAHPSTERQTLLLGEGAHPALAPTGLRFVAVEHTGCSQSSPPEAQMIREIWLSLMGQRWRDRHGVERPIGPADVVVVAPYNVQVNLLTETLPAGARVGTVDKFQGQEAAVSIVSMTTSSGDDMPRGVEFLFSTNRLNVAVSRARCLSIIVASPRLMELRCGSVEDMRLVNTLCGAYRWGGAR